MFGKLGKKYAAQVAEKIEEMTLEGLNKRNPQDVRTETANQRLNSISGNRKALYIGINYVGQEAALKGCVNDVVNIKKFIESNYEINEKMVLTDDKRAEPETDHAPTRKNIIAGFKWLIKNAKKGDSLFLHYSGHGGKSKNNDGTEASGYDQTLCPVDFQKAGMILDDDVHDILCRNLPKGVRLTAIFDCCHSESIMDLPFIYNIDGNLEITENDKNQSIATMVAAGTRFLFDGNKKNIGNVFKNEITSLVKGLASGQQDNSARQQNIEANRTNADIIMFSGCKDDQTSADATIKGESSGAMSYALIHVLKKHKRDDPTYTDVLREMRQTLEGKYTQVPCLSAGRKLDLDQPFRL